MAEQGEDEEEGRKLFVVFEAMINRSQIDRWKRREREGGEVRRENGINLSFLPRSVSFRPFLCRALPPFLFLPPTELYP